MKPIILCCGENGRAVVYGHVEKEPVPSEPVTLHDARMVLYWSEACGGLFGLATNGPRKGTRITCAVERVRETVWQEWLLVSAAAEKAFDTYE
jgi:hypothetical protein